MDEKPEIKKEPESRPATANPLDENDHDGPGVVSLTDNDGFKRPIPDSNVSIPMGDNMSFQLPNENMMKLPGSTNNLFKLPGSQQSTNGKF